MEEIKQVQPDQIGDLIAISRETFEATFGKDNTAENMQEFLDSSYNHDQLLTELETPGSSFWFLYVDGQVAGYLKLNINSAQSERVDENAMEIERIYLKESFQHRGLGQKMMDFALNCAQDLGKNPVWLGVWEHNENAKNFYARNGFTRFSQHTFVLGDDPQTDFLLKKNLD